MYNFDQLCKLYTACISNLHSQVVMVFMVLAGHNGAARICSTVKLKERGISIAMFVCVVISNALKSLKGSWLVWASVTPAYYTATHCQHPQSACRPTQSDFTLWTTLGILPLISIPNNIGGWVGLSTMNVSNLLRDASLNQVNSECTNFQLWIQYSRLGATTTMLKTLALQTWQIKTTTIIQYDNMQTEILASCSKGKVRVNKWLCTPTGHTASNSVSWHCADATSAQCHDTVDDC